MKKHLNILSVLFIVALMFSSTIVAKPNGDVSPELIQKFEEQIKSNGNDRAIMNAVTGTDLKQLTLNRELVNRHNDIFSMKIKTEGITDQKSSGR